jgi:hypothetical protein
MKVLTIKRKIKAHLAFHGLINFRVPPSFTEDHKNGITRDQANKIKRKKACHKE